MPYIPKDGFPYYRALVEDAPSSLLFRSPDTLTWFKSISEEKGNFRYAANKWSIKEVLGHITDHERIKMFRAYLLSRKQTVELWGYDQNALVDQSRFKELSMEYLVRDFELTRKASLHFIEGLSERQLQLKGSARQYEITLDDFLKSIIGHEIHHINILKRRYF